MADAFFGEDVNVWIAPADTNGSALSDSNKYSSYIMNFKNSGGSRSQESIAVFGGGSITKSGTRDQFEVSMEVVLDPAGSKDFNKFVFDTDTSDTTLYLSSGEASEVCIFIEGYDGTNYYTEAYNNVTGVSFDVDLAADDIYKGTLTFNCSPTTPTGTANVRKKAAIHSSPAFNWS